MELKKIEELLTKYLEAETSVAEEKELENYFTSQEVASHLQEYIPLFAFYKKEKRIEYKKTAAGKKKRRPSYEKFAVAASIAILGGLFFYNNNSKNTTTTTEELETIEDHKLAYQKTKEVLDLVSIYMNQGQENIEYLNEFGEATNKLIKNQ